MRTCGRFEGDDMRPLNSIPLLARTDGSLPPPPPPPPDAAASPAPRRPFIEEQVAIDWQVVGPASGGLRRDRNAGGRAPPRHRSDSWRTRPPTAGPLGHSIRRACTRPRTRRHRHGVMVADHRTAVRAGPGERDLRFCRLQPLFEIPEAENIEINGHDSVMVQYPDGTRTPHPPIIHSDDELIEAIRFLGESATPSRPFDDAHPTMTLALGDRFRLLARHWFRAHAQASRHDPPAHDDSDLAGHPGGHGNAACRSGRRAAAAVRSRRSMVISGDQGAGKTTLLRALIAAIPPTELSRHSGDRLRTLDPPAARPL